MTDFLRNYGGLIIFGIMLFFMMRKGGCCGGHGHGGHKDHGSHQHNDGSKA